MITIYNPTETSFLSDGLGVLDPIVTDATITEELNGAYYLELTAIIDDEGIFELLDYDNIIKANGQLFRILDIDKDSSFINVRALHIFYDLSNNFLEDVAPTNKNCGDALRWILDRTQFPHSFVGSSDISNVKTARYVRYSPADAIMGNIDNSMIKVWGGEVKRNNYAIEILSRLGADNGVEISYGKNIVGIVETIYKNSVMTRIMPQGFNGLHIPEKYVDSPYILSYPMPIIRKVEFPTIKVNDDPEQGDIVTESQAQDMLRDAAERMFSVDKVDLPLVNYVINFVDLTQTEEYKDYQVLESVALGDTVKVNHTRLKISVSARVIKTVWDILGNRYRNIELGNFNQNLQNYIKQMATQSSEAKMIESLMEATQLIQSGLGGYVKKTRDELLIMDTDNVNTATEVWRWNKNGLGYSSTGYNGVYGLALTKDGKINADMIKTGKLLAQFIEAVNLAAISADLGTITAGILQSTDGKLKIDLNNKLWQFEGSVVKFTPDGINVGSSTDDVNTDIKYNGVEIRDGEKLVAIFGEGGAVVPTIKSDSVDSEDVMRTVRENVTVSVGSGRDYNTITEALKAIFGTNRKYIVGGAVVTINVYGSINDRCILSGIHGSGEINIYLHGATVTGYLHVKDSTVRVYVRQGSSRGTIKNDGSNDRTIWNQNSLYLSLNNLNVDANSKFYGVSGNDGGTTVMTNVDITRATRCISAAYGHEIKQRNCKGNGSVYGAFAEENGVVYLSGTCPKGTTSNYTKSGGHNILDGTPTPTDSSFSPPPVTSETFKQVFSANKLYTVVHASGNTNSYYPNEAVQNRWDSNMSWCRGIIKFSSDVYDFFNGGSGITVRMRFRRDSSSHGTSSTIAPAPYRVNGNSWSAGFSGALRGGWTNWVTVPSSYFTGSGATFELYNGVAGAAGYARWDRCEVEVTVTKTI